MIKEIFYNLLIKHFLRFDFIKEIGEVEKIRIYQKLKDQDVVKLLKYLYTNCYSAYLLANGSERDLLKGRILQLLDLLNSIENVEEIMLAPDKYVNMNKQKNEVLSPIKDKLYVLSSFFKGRKNK